MVVHAVVTYPEPDEEHEVPQQLLYSCTPSVLSSYVPPRYGCSVLYGCSVPLPIYLQLPHARGHQSSGFVDRRGPRTGQDVVSCPLLVPRPLLELFLSQVDPILPLLILLARSAFFPPRPSACSFFCFVPGS